jgi:flavin-dependent dehydrogenase
MLARPGMRIAIAGAGVAGSYIYRLLQLRGGHRVDIFDIRHRIACGIHPCGYGVDHNFDALARRAGLDPGRYVVNQPAGRGYLEGVPIRTSVYMIDKPRLIRDLLGAADVVYERVDLDAYDLVVDATGEARAYAPPLPGDLKARVVQWRVQTKRPARLEFRPTRGVPGYAWDMPLSHDGTDTHVGGGCRAGVRHPARKLTEPAFEGLDVERVICACGAFIRVSGPDFESTVHGKVWAVGEAAGLVSPVTGAGNVYAMLSGLQLVDHLGDPAGYVDTLRRSFSGLCAEARAVRRILAGRLPTPVDVYHVRLGWARGGVYVPWRRMPQIVFLMERAFLRRASLVAA